MSNNQLTKEAEVSADCEHPEMEYLGENQGAFHEGRVWAIPTVARSRED